ncbi:TonB-dependent receptor plug domain-containing protein [Acinetobacter stercoris]|uniref:TonB-dependent Receptor Plug Domain protein n=1 Tax=Acinetobacter stercoris TaxID=2126983 RepID=A0A2U3N2N2_9GAMM|nr:TonB-dependent receptor plug domain-containing protein [Acinetobacter stercoris]SPL71893.1 TonB-dependent Receptor Plug Domain protein [Acinetobacter stercoris]
MRFTALTLAMSFIFLNQCFASQIEKVEAESKKKIHAALTKIIIKAVEDQVVGKNHYNEGQLKGMPNGNKTISEFLRKNPNVQFSQNNMGAGTQGEIKAADFSINGAMFYDNKLLFDNVSLNNSINPAAGQSSSADYHIHSLGGSSFSTTINTDLICELDVLDSNVSAEYGEFTGGVVKAKTCAPKTAVGEIHGQISYDYTSSDWTKFSYATADELEKFENNQNQNYQKDFIKRGLSAIVYGKFSEKIATSLTVSKRWSDIGFTTQLLDGSLADQKRENDNLNLNVYIQPNDQNKLKVGLQYQRDHKDLHQFNVKNSGKKTDENNQALELELETHFNRAKLTQSLVYQKQKQANDSDLNELIAWNSSRDKNWSALSTASEGGYGDKAQNLVSLEYKISSQLNPFQIANVEHLFLFGAGYGHYAADWKRLSEAYVYLLPSRLKKNHDFTCLNINGEIDRFCDLSYNNGIGQYHTRREIYKAGTIAVTQERAHLFIEDSINWNNIIKARIGLRGDFDSLNGQINYAPRSNIQYLPFSDSRLTFTSGWNRYYGNNLFSYVLQDGINKLIISQSRENIDTAWGTPKNSQTSNVQKTKLDTPFADETVFAVGSRFGIFDGQIKYVHRNYRDQIRKNRVNWSPLIDQYDNLGRIKADVYTLALSNFVPFTFAGSQHQFQFAFDYSDIKRNFSDYDDSINALTYRQYIKYDGKIIDQADRPANNFNQPWTARLGWDISFDKIPLKISHFFRLRGAYDAMVRSSIPANQQVEYLGQTVVSEYKAMKMPSAFTWDMRATYDVATGQGSKMIFGLTVKNLTNKFNKYTEDDKSTLYSESGRQFIADVSFKF